MLANANTMIDASRKPIPTIGVISTDIQTLTANNTTAHVPIFTIASSIEVYGIWGIVTTVLGANQTAAGWRVNDQTNQSDITLATGTTISAAPIGSMVVKNALAASALTLNTSAQERVVEPATAQHPYLSPFSIVAKNGAKTQIEWSYTTTDTPTSGVIQFFLAWIPLAADSNVTPV